MPVWAQPEHRASTSRCACLPYPPGRRAAWLWPGAHRLASAAVPVTGPRAARIADERAAGTASQCFLGVSRALAAALPAHHRVMIVPAESAVLSGGPPGTHNIEGGGIGQRPPLLGPAGYDEVIAVPEAEVFETARRCKSGRGGRGAEARVAAAARIRSGVQGAGDRGGGVRWP